MHELLNLSEDRPAAIEISNEVIAFGHRTRKSMNSDTETQLVQPSGVFGGSKFVFEGRFVHNGPCI